MRPCTRSSTAVPTAATCAAGPAGSCPAVSRRPCCGGSRRASGRTSTRPCGACATCGPTAPRPRPSPCGAGSGRTAGRCPGEGSAGAEVLGGGPARRGGAGEEVGQEHELLVGVAGADLVQGPVHAAVQAEQLGPTFAERADQAGAAVGRVALAGDPAG